MILEIFNNSGSNSYSVTILSNMASRPSQQVEYVTTMDGVVNALNYGSDYDKWNSKVTITAPKATAINIANDLNKDINQVLITVDDGELLFGAGIDYTLPIYCNITNPKRDHNQEDFATAEIELSIEAVGYKDGANVTQLFYKSATPSTMPWGKLNYQVPIDREINKQEMSFNTDSFGSYGMITKVDESGEPLNTYALKLQFSQTEDEAAQIEKFVSVNRSEPFFLEQIDNLQLFEGQDSERVIVTGFVTQRANLNDWRITLDLAVVPGPFPNKMLVAVDSSGTGIEYSYDSGSTWSDGVIAESCQVVQFCKASFVACPDGFSNDSNLYTSTDGINFSLTQANTLTIRTIVYGDGLIIAPEHSNRTGYLSYDFGQTWSLESFTGDGATMNGISKGLYADGYFYLVGTNGVFRSTDGIDYTKVLTFSPPIGIREFLHGDSGFIVYYSSTTSYKSSDGLSWSVVSPGANIFNGGAFGDGKYVTVDGTGRMVSTDLITFNTYSDANNIVGLTVHYDGTYFVTDRIRSTDGQNWTTIPLTKRYISGN